MRLAYTHHARQRMKQRGITDGDVRYCLENHVQSFKRADDRTEYMAQMAGRNLTVVVVEPQSANDNTVVISTYWRS